MSTLAGQIATVRTAQSIEVVGEVISVRGLTLCAQDLRLPVGAIVRLDPGPGVREADAPRGEIIGFDGGLAVVMLLAGTDGVAPGTRIIGERAAPTALVGAGMLGRVVDGLGRPIDGGPRLTGRTSRPLHPAPQNAMQRPIIHEPMPTGVRAIDSMLTVGKGQRVGVFAGPGVGKSSLLASIARGSSAHVNVIALIGERGREVREFIDGALGPEGLARSAVVVATGDESPLLRARAALYACTIAEYFRDTGRDVMFMMDSVTRFAQALRQIGLAVGEQPATKGYTPSVFARLPLLLERAGALEGRGSITGFYAVLVEGDDLAEPISDAARGILDGHIVLSRRLAARGHYPAIDLLESVSRVADKVCDAHHADARRELLRLIAAYSESEELITIGAYARGSNAVTDAAIELKDTIDGFLRQRADEGAEYPWTCRQLIELAGAAATRVAAGRSPGVSA